MTAPESPVAAGPAGGEFRHRPPCESQGLKWSWVGPFRVFAGSSDEAIERIAGLALPAPRLRSAFALHVGGLAAMGDEAVVDAYESSDVTYADGMSIVLAARVTSGVSIERASTTDIGIPVLRLASDRLGRNVRVALIGGPPGLAIRAGQAISTTVAAEIVLFADGYSEDWSTTIDGLRVARPDVVLVGMGAPREMQWVYEHRSDLPPALYLTCGGWFGFLAGEERRSPGWMQKVGLEWVFRVFQNPRRKMVRYVAGVWYLGRAIVDGRARYRRAGE